MLLSLPLVGLARIPKIEVRVFLAVDCPISNRYVPEMKRLAATYRKLGVDWRAIFPDTKLKPDEMERWVKEYEVDFPVAQDKGLAEAKRAGATVTPEAAVFVEGRLVYRGRIDDRYSGFGKSRPEPDKRDLKECLDAALAGRRIAFHSTRSWGCNIELHPQP